MFPGCWDPDFKKFYNVSERANCWLSDGINVEIYKDNMDHYNNDPRFGFSVRLLKD